MTPQDKQDHHRDPPHPEASTPPLSLRQHCSEDLWASPQRRRYLRSLNQRPALR